MTRFFRDKQTNVNNATLSQSCSGTNSKVTRSVKCIINQWLKCLLNVHRLLPFILSNHKVVTSKWMWTPHACLSQWQWRLIGTSKQMQNHPDSTSNPTQRATKQLSTRFTHTWSMVMLQQLSIQGKKYCIASCGLSAFSTDKTWRKQRPPRCCKVKEAPGSYAEIHPKKVQDLTVLYSQLGAAFVFTFARSPGFQIWLHKNEEPQHAHFQNLIEMQRFCQSWLHILCSCGVSSKRKRKMM